MNRSFARLLSFIPTYIRTYVRTVQKLEKSRAHIKCSANLHNILSGSVAVMLINLFTRWKIHGGRLGGRLHAEVNPPVCVSGPAHRNNLKRPSHTSIFDGRFVINLDRTARRGKGAKRRVYTLARRVIRVCVKPVERRSNRRAAAPLN